MFIDNQKPAIRTGDFVLHCTRVKVWQKIQTGIQLSGHGTIKINLNGCLYLEFICTKSENLPNVLFNQKIPEDTLLEEQKLFLEVESLDGDIFISSGFSITINMNTSRASSCMYIFLSDISSASELENYSDKPNYLHFEFSEYFDIPTNKMNSESSTLGSSSSSWNETVIKSDDVSISMVKKDGYVSVNATGEFDTNRVLECLLFYIGFSGGVMPQPYITIRRNGAENTTTIHSIDNSYKHKRSSNPMVSSVAEKEYKESHYQLFKSILDLRATTPKVYESIYSQWNQVWHAFQSENAITSLTLSVAIEGLLNDIFIPAIKKNVKDEELEEDIKQIKALVSDLDISPKHKDRLLGSVSYWKNISAAKALEFLLNEGIITIDEKKLWTKMRNECAHPKVRDDSLASQQLDRDRVLSCLNLFHNLIFNVLKYSGPRFYFRIGSKSNTFDMIEHKEVLSSSLY